MQQFRDEVRNSPEVKFAVQAFTAVNNNNFVRFFKLVKGASYLAGCLLHRYFNQVGSRLALIMTAKTSKNLKNNFSDIFKLIMSDNRKTLKKKKIIIHSFCIDCPYKMSELRT